MSQPSSVSPTRRAVLKSSAAMTAAATIASISPSAYAQGSDKIRVGVVGLGGRGKGAAANCVDSSKNVQIVALADLFQDQVDKALAEFSKRPKEKYDIKKEMCFAGWDAYKKLLATDVDYVILATPPGFRPFMIQAAVDAKKHVFGEKPVAVDPHGVKLVEAAAEKAAKQNTGMVIGTQRRHQTAYIETIKRLHDGAIGDIKGGNVYWMQGSLWTKPRKPDWSDTEWQIRNWLYFTWLSGDHIVEQHLHQIDVMCWVMGGPPKLAIAMGGRQVRTDPQFGHIYDHFAVEYEYSSGARINSMCRQQDGTYARIQENFIGSKGSALAGGTIYDASGKRAYRYEDPEDENVQTNPYVLEHRDLVESIRNGKPLNAGKEAAVSTLAAIMGRESAYTGKLVTWSQILKSDESLFPKGKTPETMEFGPMPVPPVAMPGTGKAEAQVVE